MHWLARGWTAMGGTLPQHCFISVRCNSICPTTPLTNSEWKQKADDDCLSLATNQLLNQASQVWEGSWRVRCPFFFFNNCNHLFLASSALVKNITPMLNYNTYHNLFGLLVVQRQLRTWQSLCLFTQFKHLKPCQAIKTVRQMTIFQCLPSQYAEKSVLLQFVRKKDILKSKSRQTTK